MSEKNRAWAEIDLDAVGHNVREIMKRLNPGVKLLGVVKADAYGHGVCEVAKTVLENGAQWLGVAFCDEAVELRKMGFDVPILVLGNTLVGEVKKIVEFDISATVSDVNYAEELSREAVLQGKCAKVHVKVDTGMSRIGFVTSSEEDIAATVDAIGKISELPNIELEGMFTHFATADDVDEAYTRLQYERFMKVDEELKARGIKIPLKHACNSAGMIKFPEMHLDMVRAGIILYGLYPSEDIDRKLIDLMPAMSFKARVTQIKELKKGDSISYGRTFECEEKLKVATVSVGYADGYSRSLSNKAKVMIGGQIVNQIGRICMDQCMIDVSKVNNINVGDEVTLMGDEAPFENSADGIAELMGTISYEVVCNVGRRVPRVYIKDGRIVETLNYILND